MTEGLRAAFREAAEAAPVFGDPAAARRSAGRRRSARTTGAAAVAAFAVAISWLAVTHLATRADRRLPETPVSPPPTRGVAAAESGLAQSLLYRSCAEQCRVGVLDHEDLIGLRSGLSQRLATTGVQGVTLSPDGLFVGYPHHGALTVTHVYSQPQASVTVPAGPAGSQWRPYYWTQGEMELVVAQWTGDTVTGLGVVHVGYGTNPVMKVDTTVVPPGAHLVPIGAGAALDNLVPVMRADARAAGQGPDAVVYQYQWRRVGPSMYPNDGGGGYRRSWAACLRPGESLIGPEGVQTTFTVAPETSGDQDAATVVYARTPQGATPAAMFKGNCGSSTFTRYDLPTSEGQVTWQLIGPLNRRTSLMTRDTADGPMDLVEVSAKGQTLMGTVPPDSQIVSPGMTGGFLR